MYWNIRIIIIMIMPCLVGILYFFSTVFIYLKIIIIIFMYIYIFIYIVAYSWRPFVSLTEHCTPAPKYIFRQGVCCVQTIHIFFLVPGTFGDVQMIVAKRDAKEEVAHTWGYIDWSWGKTAPVKIWRKIPILFYVIRKSNQRERKKRRIEIGGITHIYTSFFQDDVRW